MILSIARGYVDELNWNKRIWFAFDRASSM
jgi:hypothetical protein